MNACKRGIERFIKQTGANDDELYDVADLIGGENTYSDLLWLVGKKIDKNRIVRFACDCALINIELIKPYTDKYDLIIEFLKNPTRADAARAAAYADDAATAAARAAAYADADAARAAAYADDAAAADTADAAAYAAYAACAADNADADADAAAIDQLLRDMINEY